MKWKSFSNFIIVIILSLAYVMMALLNVVGPLHMNATGGMNHPGVLPENALCYLIVALVVTWSVYLFLRKKPETLFFVSLIIGIIFFLFGAFLWHFLGA